MVILRNMTNVSRSSVCLDASLVDSLVNEVSLDISTHSCDMGDMSWQDELHSWPERNGGWICRFIISGFSLIAKGEGKCWSLAKAAHFSLGRTCFLEKRRGGLLSICIGHCDKLESVTSGVTGEMTRLTHSVTMRTTFNSGHHNWCTYVVRCLRRCSMIVWHGSAVKTVKTCFSTSSEVRILQEKQWKSTWRKVMLDDRMGQDPKGEFEFFLLLMRMELTGRQRLISLLSSLKRLCFFTFSF